MCTMEVATEVKSTVRENHPWGSSNQLKIYKGCYNLNEIHDVSSKEWIWMECLKIFICLSLLKSLFRGSKASIWTINMTQGLDSAMKQQCNWLYQAKFNSVLKLFLSVFFLTIPLSFRPKQMIHWNFWVDINLQL